MEEKIKISLPKSTNSILIKDAENFGFYKNETAINKNCFINTLIVNYYDIFSNDEKDLHNDLRKALNDVLPKQKDDLFENIIKVFSKNNKRFENDDETTSLSFKPTKSSKKVINYINNILISNESISSYYRRLFISYVHKPINERELIIFKENYQLINNSIKNKLKVCIFLRSNSIFKDISIYAVASSRDELYNYVLCIDSNENLYTIRLAKISNITLTNKKSEISDNIKKIFDKQIKYGVQYPIGKEEHEQIIVTLNSNGKELFKRIYLYRPMPTKIEGNDYYFECSYQQILHYFKRFGKHAIIKSPNQLGIKMRNYYYSACTAYKKINYEK